MASLGKIMLKWMGVDEEGKVDEKKKKEAEERLLQQGRQQNSGNMSQRKQLIEFDKEGRMK